MSESSLRTEEASGASTAAHGWRGRLVQPPSAVGNQPPAASVPPSTCTVVPVTKRERSDARKRAAPATSSGVPNRPSGTHVGIKCCCSGVTQREYGTCSVSTTSGAIALHANPVARVFDAEAAGEAGDRGLECGVDGPGGDRAERLDRRHGHDAPALTAIEHVHQCGARTTKDVPEVDAVEVVPLVVGVLVERLTRAAVVPDVVQHHVDAAELGDRPRNRGFGTGGRADVDHLHASRPSASLDRGHRLRGRARHRSRRRRPTRPRRRTAARCPVRSRRRRRSRPQRAPRATGPRSGGYRAAKPPEAFKRSRNVVAVVGSENPVQIDPGSFCRALYPRLVGALSLSGANRDDAEELAEETLSRVLEHWEHVQQLDDPEAWAFRTGFNLTNSWWRRRAVARRVEERLRRRRGDGCRVARPRRDRRPPRPAFARLRRSPAANAR